MSQDFTIYQYVPQQVVISAESLQEALQIANAKAREEGAILVSDSPDPDKHLQQALGINLLQTKIEGYGVFLVLIVILQIATMAMAF